MRNCSISNFKQIFKMIDDTKKYKENNYQNNSKNEFIIM